MIKRGLIIFLISFSFYGQSQAIIDSAIYFLDSYHLARAYEATDKIDDKFTKELLEFQLDYMSEGKQNSNLLEGLANKIDTTKLSEVEKVLFADYLVILNEPQKNELISSIYFNAYFGENRLSHSFKNHALKNLNFHVLSKIKDTVLSNRYIDVFEKQKGIPNHNYWLHNLKIRYQFLATDSEISKIDGQLMDGFFDALFRYADKDEFMLGSAHQLRGIYNAHWKENYPSSISDNEKALAFYRRVPFWYAQKKILGLEYNNALTNLRMNDTVSAVEFLKNDFSRDKGNFLKLETAKTLHRYYARKTNYFDAYRYSLVEDSINELVERANREEFMNELETKYQTSQKEKQILIEQQRATKNRNWLIAAGLALLFGTGIAILLQKNTTKKRQLAEQEAILKQQRVDNLLKEQELVSIDAMIAGQEKERQKVAGELHDDLGSLMATIKLHFDNTKVSKKDPALKNAQKLLEEAYQKIRGMAHSKNSGVMSDQGLLSAIKKMARTITETNALEVSVEDFGLGERMENSLELSIFRMVQELVANAIKHAEASKVSIQLTQHKDNLNIIIEDNGKGFDRSKLDQGKSGMGLTNIEKRVEHLEGNFTVDSVLGKGTSVLIDIPV